MVVKGNLDFAAVITINNANLVCRSKTAFASKTELEENPRSRSAKLRVAEKL